MSNHLLHLSTVSIDVTKIKSIQWKLANGTQINYECTSPSDLPCIMLFKHSPEYGDDIERLEKAVGR